MNLLPPKALPLFFLFLATACSQAELQGEENALQWSSQAQRAVALAGLPDEEVYDSGNILLHQIPSDSAPGEAMKEQTGFIIGRMAQHGKQWCEIATKRERRSIGWTVCPVRAEPVRANYPANLPFPPRHYRLSRFATHAGLLLGENPDALPAELGSLLSREKNTWEVADIEIEDHVFTFEGVKLTLAQGEEGLFLRALEFTRPGFGVGGLLIGVEGFDKAYVKRIMGESNNPADLLDITEDDDGGETWHYLNNDGMQLLDISFRKDGLIHQVIYAYYVD
ncbi:MAG: hypothetical protein LBS89_08940 [Zoogloeaceae bacterium]|jgi:hypothetical protein|nr:hypothetical protein [Zoogloeaceae bacterium]